MEFQTALEKFNHYIADPKTYECFFEYSGKICQISYCGRYILVEDKETNKEEEYTFKENGKERIEAFLEAKVFDKKTKTARQVLAEMEPDRLIIKNN